MRVVIFIQNTPLYIAKTRAGFPDEVAKSLVDRGVARYEGEDYPIKEAPAERRKKRGKRNKG